MKQGEYVDQGQPIAEIETSKTSLCLVAEVAGYVGLWTKVGDELEVGERIADILESPLSPDDTLKDKKLMLALRGSDNQNSPVFSAKARNAIFEWNLELDQFKQYDFVRYRDVKDLHGLQEGGIASKNFPNKETLNNSLASYTPKKISANKSREIRYLQAVQSSDLVSDVSVEIDAKELIDYSYENHQYFRYSISPSVMHHISRLLREYNLLNAFWLEGTINTYEKINLSYAIDGEFGLKAVVLPRTDNLEIKQIDELLFSKVGLYKENQLAPEDVANGTFTISELNYPGIRQFRPLVNQRQSAVISIPAVSPSSSVIMTLSFDHRVISGRYVADFLSDLKERLENIGGS